MQLNVEVPTKNDSRYIHTYNDYLAGRHLIVIYSSSSLLTESSSESSGRLAKTRLVGITTVTL